MHAPSKYNQYIFLQRMRTIALFCQCMSSAISMFRKHRPDRGCCYSPAPSPAMFLPLLLAAGLPVLPAAFCLTLHCTVAICCHACPTACPLFCFAAARFPLPVLPACTPTLANLLGRLCRSSYTAPHQTGLYRPRRSCCCTVGLALHVLPPTPVAGFCFVAVLGVLSLLASFACMFVFCHCCTQAVTVSSVSRRAVCCRTCLAATGEMTKLAVVVDFRLSGC
jgi:hypothetical protein